MKDNPLIGTRITKHGSRMQGPVLVLGSAGAGIEWTLLYHFDSNDILIVHEIEMIESDIWEWDAELINRIENIINTRPNRSVAKDVLVTSPIFDKDQYFLYRLGNLS